MNVCSAIVASVRLSSESGATKSHPGNRSHEKELKEPRVFNQRKKSQNGKRFYYGSSFANGKRTWFNLYRSRTWTKISGCCNRRKNPFSIYRRAWKNNNNKKLIREIRQPPGAKSIRLLNFSYPGYTFLCQGFAEVFVFYWVEGRRKWPLWLLLMLWSTIKALYLLFTSLVWESHRFSIHRIAT